MQRIKVMPPFLAFSNTSYWVWTDNTEVLKGKCQSQKDENTNHMCTSYFNSWAFLALKLISMCVRVCVCVHTHAHVWRSLLAPFKSVTPQSAWQPLHSRSHSNSTRSANEKRGLGRREDGMILRHHSVWKMLTHTPTLSRVCFSIWKKTFISLKCEPFPEI